MGLNIASPSYPNGKQICWNGAALDGRASGPAWASLFDQDSNGKADMDSIIKLLSRLLSCVLGAPLWEYHYWEIM